jgi:hypothetical protein
MSLDVQSSTHNAQMMPQEATGRSQKQNSHMLPFEEETLLLNSPVKQKTVRNGRCEQHCAAVDACAG